MDRDVYLMNADGSNMYTCFLQPVEIRKVPSFSPDGQWVALHPILIIMATTTACEIYIMRVDGSDPSTSSGQALRRLTDNDYCDYQPRWGP